MRIGGRTGCSRWALLILAWPGAGVAQAGVEPRVSTRPYEFEAIDGVEAQRATGLGAWAHEAVGGAVGSAAGLGVYLLTASDPEGCPDYGCYFRELGGMLALASAGSAAGAWVAGRMAGSEPSPVGAVLGAVAGAAVALVALKAVEEINPPRGDEGASGVLTFTISQGALTALGSRIGAALR